MELPYGTLGTPPAVAQGLLEAGQEGPGGTVEISSEVPSAGGDSSSPCLWPEGGRRW